MSGINGLSFNSSVRMEADFSLPQSPGEFTELVEDWFLGALDEVISEDLDPRRIRLDLSDREEAFKNSGVPYGRPGELWASLWTASMQKRGRRLAGTVWTAESWRKFLKGAQGIPLKMAVRISRLGPDGFPASPWVAVTMERFYEAPDWMTLSIDQSTESLVDPDLSLVTQEKMTRFLSGFLDRDRVCLFGGICDDIDRTTGRTALESSLGIFPDETLPLLDAQLRGYSWVTVCSPGVFSLVGGRESLTQKGAFDSITPLDTGGVILQATRDMREYGEQEIGAVFDALKPALPPGKPIPYISDFVPRLVFADAAKGC